MDTGEEGLVVGEEGWNRTKQEIERLKNEQVIKRPLLLFQFPTHFPVTPQHAQQQTGIDPKAFAAMASAPPSQNQAKPFSSSADYTLRTLPPGKMAKLLFYKSGKIKLSIGGSQFEVNQATGTLFDQEVVSVDASEGHYYSLGHTNKRAICSMDVASVLKAKKIYHGPSDKATKTSSQPPQKQ